MSLNLKKYSKDEKFLIPGNKLFGDDLMLILLDISDIRNNTFLQKEVFLLWQEYLYEKSADLSYFPYFYGPYSYVIKRFSEYLERLTGQSNTTTNTLISIIDTSALSLILALENRIGSGDFLTSDETGFTVDSDKLSVDMDEA